METTRLRDGVNALSVLAERDLRRLLRDLDEDARVARDALGDILPILLACNLQDAVGYGLVEKGLHLFFVLARGLQYLAYCRRRIRRVGGR